MATIHIIKRETIPGTQYPLQKVTFQKPDLEGKLHEQVNEIYFRPDAVAILMVDAEAQRFLLARQFRLPTFLNENKNGYLTETCAGLINEGETPEEAARITEFVHLFTANYQSGGPHEKGGGKAGEGEDIELLELSFSDAREQLKQGAMSDAKTMLLIQHYFLTLNP
jgi:GDP-mannose pyrophosphatase NudK